MKVLIAEDEPISRRSLEERLVQWGYEVTVTRDGVEAWQVLQEKNLHSMAILDWIMPGMDGTEVCRRVRKFINGRPPYTILLVARDFLEDFASDLGTGADAYVAKPVNFDELRYRLETGMKVSNLQR
jgi:DNA-binding response OmpR family regulator